MNKRLMSIFLIIALLFSCVPSLDSVYAEVEYQEHVLIKSEGEEIDQRQITVGESIILYAEVEDNQGKKVTDYSMKDTKYSWTSQDETKATVSNNVYGIGTITGIDPGTFKVIVESIDRKNCEPKEIEITVIEDKLKYEGHVKINNEPEKKEIKVGEEIDLYAIVVDEKGEEILDWEDNSKYTNYKWESKNTEVLKIEVDQWDTYAAKVKAIASGKAVLRIESEDCEPKEIEITVIEDKLKYEGHVKINNEPEKKEIKVGEEIDLYAIVVDEKGEEILDWEDNSKYTNYKWESKNTEVLKIEVDQWDTYAAKVKAIASGKAVLRIESENCEPKEIEITVIDDKPVPQEGEIASINISLDQDIEEIECGRNIKLNVMAKDSKEKEIKKPHIVWKIEPKDSATIDDNHIFHASKSGSICIKATTEKVDKNPIESNTLSLKVIQSKTREEKINEAIDNLKIRYKNPTFYGSDGLSDKYIGELALALRYSGMNIEEINKTKKIFSTDAGAYSLLNTSKNIMTLIAVNEDLKEEVEKILDDSFVFYKDNDVDAEKLIYAIIALDMADAEYNKTEAVKALISMMKKDSDGKNYIESYEHIDVNLTAKAMIALSKHKEIEGATDVIDGIKKCLKSLQSESGLIKDDSTSGIGESCSVTAELIQGIIALEEDPLDEYWTIEDKYGNKNNLVDAVLACRDGQRFKKSLNGSVANIQTDAAIAALADLKSGKSMYHELKYVKAGVPSKIEITNEEHIEVVEGDTVEIKATVYDKDNNVVRNESIQWESSDLEKATVENGLVKALGDGVVKIKVYLEKNQDIFDEITINIKAGTSPEILKQRLKEEIEFLKAHYEAYDQYEFVAAPASIISGIDEIKVQEKLQTYRKYTSTYQYATLIISALGAELEPRNIELEGSKKNSVDILRSHQIKEGKNKGQFIINNYSDTDSIETLGYSIIALDMADADYDKESATKALIKLLEDPNIKMKLGQDEVKIKAVALTAFANHKSIEGVTEQIKSIINLLKEKQSNDGGFGSKLGMNSVIATARVTQALIANEINPLYDKRWMKNKKTVMDNMLKNKYEHPTDISKSGFSKFGGGALDYHSTYYAFAAFTDMYSNESMFKRFAKKYDKKIIAGEIRKIDILQKDPNKIFKMLMGQPLKLQVAAFDNQDNWIENPAIIWTSSDEEKATVKDGFVEAKTIGQVTITATIKDTKIKNSIKISIEDSGIKNIKIQCNKDKIRVGDTIELKSQGFNKIDQPLEGLSFTWEVDNKDVAKLYEREGKMYLEGLTKGKIVLKTKLKNQPNIKHEMSIDVIDKKLAKVKVSVEGLDETIVPLTEIEVENLDLGKYGNGSCILEENPTAMNTVIAALQKNNIDCMDNEQFYAGGELSRITNIKGMKESAEGLPYSGWLYFINNDFPKTHAKETQIHKGDTISLVYLKDYRNQFYAYFDKNEKKVKTSTSFTINLKENVSKDKAMDEHEKKNIENAQIFVDGKPYVVEGKNVVTDQDGNAVLKFEKEGEYHITATRITGGVVDITKPHCKVIVTNELEQFEVKLSNEKYSKGEEARLTMIITNSDEEPSNMLCKIQLCDESNKVLKASSIEKVLEGNGKTTLAPGFSIPDEGRYKIKIFLSDGKEENIFEPTKTIEIN
ncbi:Ig-like domain-containing protein [Lutibacter sp. B2]|nr:Ig-like domain-containing protein [Lutibacter sp. B2]